MSPTRFFCLGVCLALVGTPLIAADQPLPEWTAKIRPDHPRLFFNSQTWPAVKQRALGAEHDWYRRVQLRVDGVLAKTTAGSQTEPQDLGPEAAAAAFVYRMTEDPRYLDLAKTCLQTSVAFYEQCYDQRKTVNWYSTSRVHAVLAWDWLYAALSDTERREFMSRLIVTIDRVLKAKPPIYRENLSGYDTGFYGVRNCLWFIGCTAFGTGIETDLVNQWLVWGHDENRKLLTHRQRACGDDGGGASSTLGYVFGAYPWSEQNFFYCLFTCGGILRQHRHYDALNFVIYQRGFLALDSGTRYEEFTNGQHLANYYAQTVAHNCVVIHQPGEPVAPYWGGTVEGNHGGQHRQLGSVLQAFETNDDFIYVAGDATACYQHGVVRREGQAELPEKCSLATRQLVFLLPRHFVIFDRVTTTDAGYRKDWLTHTAHEPVLDGTAFRADHGAGRMWCRTLLPKNARLTPVGGPGNEFLAAGKNWTIDARGLRPEHLAMLGQWRVEVTPPEPRKEELFLHVIQVGDQQLAAMSPTSLIEEKGRCGVRLTAAQDTWEVTFSTTGDLTGHIRRTGPANPIDRPLTSSVQPQTGLMLRPNPLTTDRWQLTKGPP